MPSEEKQKINVWIPGSLWKQVGNFGYESPTKATIAAFKALVLQEEKGSSQEALGSSEEELRKLQEEVRKYQEENRKLQEEIGKAPNLVEFIRLQAIHKGQQEIIREKDRTVERLESDLQKAGQREEDLKQMHNNYMLQVQSLINARALTPSGSTKEATRKKQEKTGSNQEATESRPAEKPLIEKVCKYCGETFYTDNIRKIYCSKDCKDAAYNEKRRKERKQANTEGRK